MRPKGKKPVRLRDFIQDRDGWLYAVATYDNMPRVGCTLRYIPDPDGERNTAEGRSYHKLDFEEAYELISRQKPQYRDLIQRVPYRDIVRVLKPEEELVTIMRRSAAIRKLIGIFNLPRGTIGCTGSYLCGLETGASDIDLVVYGRDWFAAQNLLKRKTLEGRLEGIDEEMWKRIYQKRNPDLGFSEFVLHEKRKWNRGQIDGTYFDLLYARSYDDANPVPGGKGMPLGKRTIVARVRDATLSHDNPAVYEIEHDEIKRVLSFTHTYSGQAHAGEIIEARGVCEEHGDEQWLVVGTTREARGEFIRSLTLLESGDGA